MFFQGSIMAGLVPAISLRLALCESLIGMPATSAGMTGSASYFFPQNIS